MKLFPFALSLLLLGAHPGRGDETAELSKKYILQYPLAERFCQPIPSAFYDASRTWTTVRGRSFRHKANGGYGLPVVAKQDGKNLLHVGADLGWYRVGAPIYAVANGVVRMSLGPKFKQDPKARIPVHPGAMAWGNFVVIEHRLPGDKFCTTLYGHLGSQRLVETGQIVRAGQQIGTIGRKHLRINGGYNPHLHFGVRAGRVAEVGAVLTRLSVDGQMAAIRLGSLNEDEIELKLPDEFRLPPQIQVNGRVSFEFSSAIQVQRRHQ